MTAVAQQGHRYRYRGQDVLALDSGPVVWVGELWPGELWFSRQWLADAVDLQPLPMRYFHGEVPRA